VPPLFHVVAIATDQGVGDLDRAACASHLAPVGERVFESPVASMLANEMVPGPACFESNAPRGRMIQPHEFASLDRLVKTVHRHRVVRARPTKIGSPLGLPMVGIRSRVDQDFTARHGQANRERVGMPMRCDSKVAQRARVDQ
jgi:hypothetical protein